MEVLLLFVSLSRFYVGVHYPTDVLAAICLGFSSLLISKYFI
ncbi:MULTISPECIES: phosphatase PAP2 family protein [Enterococcus]|nr:phosphatase PAP2 family protein [Enterococcus hirae]